MLLQYSIMKKRMGPPAGRQFNKPNPVEHRADGTTVITLDYKGQPLACTIDTTDFGLVSMHIWSASKNRKTFYAIRVMRINGKPTRISMHSLILPPPFGFEVDHEDRNGLNNRRSNLRHATRRQQQINQRFTGRKYRGVSYDSASSRWMAQIRVNGRQTFLGRHDTAEAAAHAYDAAAKQYHGEFAALNFPPPEAA